MHSTVSFSLFVNRDDILIIANETRENNITGDVVYRIGEIKSEEKEESDSEED